MTDVTAAQAAATPDAPRSWTLSRLFYGTALNICRFETLKLDFTAAVLERIGEHIPVIGPATALAIGGTARSLSAGYKTMMPALQEERLPDVLTAVGTTLDNLVERVVDLVPRVIAEVSAMSQDSAAGGPVRSAPRSAAPSLSLAS